MVNHSSFFARDAIPLLSSFIAPEAGLLTQLLVLLCEHVPLQGHILLLVLERRCVLRFLLFGQRFDCRTSLRELRLPRQLLRAERLRARVADLAGVQGFTLFREIHIAVLTDLAAIRLDHFNRNILCHNS